MALFVVRHQHEAQRCPAEDPSLGATLLNYLSRPNVATHGVDIRGEAVVQGEHTMYLIVEAEDEGRIRGFMEPFASAGTVDVYPASTCARVVANGGCTSALPELEHTDPVVEPEEACHNAIEAGLVVHRAHPLNCETSVPALIGGVVMPNAHFYVRNHFPIPALDRSAWRLEVGGLVDRPLGPPLAGAPADALADSRRDSGVRRERSVGSGATGGRRAVGAGRGQHGGVDGRASRRGPRSSRHQGGSHRGVVPRSRPGRDPGQPGTESFERSLSVDDARGSDALLAYAMNGVPLPVQHGYPLRLIVPVGTR